MFADDLPAVFPVYQHRRATAATAGWLAVDDAAPVKVVQAHGRGFIFQCPVQVADLILFIFDEGKGTLKGGFDFGYPFIGTVVKRDANIRMN